MRTTRTCSSAIICAFGHLGAPAGQDWLLAQRAHPDTYVREAVAFALGGRPGEETLQALVELSARRGRQGPRLGDVRARHARRDDTPVLRDALAARLDDPDEDTRMEAVHGLALRGDERAQAPARDLLEGRDTTDDGVWRRHLLAETAEKLDNG